MRAKFLVLPVAIILCWFILAKFTLIPAILLPSPGEVFRRLLSLVFTGEILPDLIATLSRVLAGFFLAAVVGIGIGLVMGSSRLFRDATGFPVDFLRSIPATALFPLFLIVLGVGNRANIALTAFPCVWIMTINTMYGVRNSSQVRKQIAQVFRASRTQQFFRVTVPDASPYIVTGIRLSIAIAMHMAIVAEMFTGTLDGLGRRIFDAQMLLRIPEMYAVIILTGIMGYVLNMGWLAIEHRVVHWVGK
jgi:ABC-type nitrate/sulfonate/bicarbonate transport system permease component